jgi:midasin (ATPase involved in ribosome maturation)
MTLRDLFRWAERYRLATNSSSTFYDWDRHLADEGYLVLAGRVRKDEDAQVIREVLVSNHKKAMIYGFFTSHQFQSLFLLEIRKSNSRLASILSTSSRSTRILHQ